MPSEAQRAADYRQMVRGRGRNKRNAERRLTGDPVARTALDDKTKALLTGPDEDGVRRVDLHR